MKCSCCEKEIVPDSYFCIWCGAFQPDPDKGCKAGLFARWLALFLDPFLFFLKWAFAAYVLALILPSEMLPFTAIAVFLFPAAYVLWFLVLLGQGQTPGKKILGLQVVKQQTGEIPGFATMFVREVVGRIVSGLFLGLGYFWAIFDKNSQAWHDKIAGTVVVKLSQKKPSALPAMILVMLVATTVGVIRAQNLPLNAEPRGTARQLNAPIQRVEFTRRRTESRADTEVRRLGSEQDGVHQSAKQRPALADKNPQPKTEPSQAPPNIFDDPPAVKRKPRETPTAELGDDDRAQRNAPASAKSLVAEVETWKFEVKSATYEQGKITVKVDVQNKRQALQAVWAEKDFLKNGSEFAALVTNDGVKWSISDESPLVDHATFGFAGEGLKKLDNKMNVYLPNARRTHTLVFTTDEPKMPRSVTLHLGLSGWDAAWANANGFVRRPRPLQTRIDAIPVKAGPPPEEAQAAPTEPEQPMENVGPFVAADETWKVEVTSATFDRGHITVVFVVQNQGQDWQALWIEKALLNQDTDLASLVSNTGTTWSAGREDNPRCSLLDHATYGFAGSGLESLQNGAKNQYLPRAKQTHTLVFTAEEPETPQTVTLHLGLSGWDPTWAKQKGFRGRPRPLQIRIGQISVK